VLAVRSLDPHDGRFFVRDVDVNAVGFVRNRLIVPLWAKSEKALFFNYEMQEFPEFVGGNPALNTDGIAQRVDYCNAAISSDRENRLKVLAVGETDIPTIFQDNDGGGRVCRKPYRCGLLCERQSHCPRTDNRGTDQVKSPSLHTIRYVYGGVAVTLVYCPTMSPNTLKRLSLPCYLLVGLFLSACGGQERSTQESAAPMTAAVSLTQKPEQPTQIRRLVRKAELDLRVADTMAAAESVTKLVAQLEGHIGSSSANRIDENLHYSMTIRVPESRLDEAIAGLKKLADEVRREWSSAEDVTEQYVDLNARLLTLEATEKELRALLAESRQRQQKAEEIMAIYRELTTIRTNIEQIRGQLNVLQNLTSLATINLSLSPSESPTTVVTSWRPTATISASFQSLATTLTVLADFAIVLVIVVLPTLLILALSVWLLLKVWQAARTRRRISA
jgi:hypothetical protein